MDNVYLLYVVYVGTPCGVKTVIDATQIMGIEDHTSLAIQLFLLVRKEPAKLLYYYNCRRTGCRAWRRLQAGTSSIAPKKRDIVNLSSTIHVAVIQHASTLVPEKGHDHSIQHNTDSTSTTFIDNRCQQRAISTLSSTIHVVLVQAGQHLITLPSQQDLKQEISCPTCSTMVRQARVVILIH